MDKKPWKLTASGIAVKQNPTIKIMTQLRLVKNKDYDPISDRTWEAVSETVEHGESITEALLRGFREESGDENFIPVRIIGQNSNSWTTGKQFDSQQDLQECHRPFCFTQNLSIPQPWTGPCFIVEVSSGWEPRYEKGDGEAGSHK